MNLYRVEQKKFRELSQKFTKWADWAVHWQVTFTLPGSTGGENVQTGDIFLLNPLDIRESHSDQSHQRGHRHRGTIECDKLLQKYIFMYATAMSHRFLSSEDGHIGPDQVGQHQVSF